MGALHTGATVFSFFNFLLLLFAFYSDYWIEDSDVHLGLHRVCRGTQCDLVELVPAYLHAILIFMSLGIIAGAVSFFGHLTLIGQGTPGNDFKNWIAYIFSFTLATVHATQISMILGMIAGVVSLVGFCILIGQWRPDNNVKSSITCIASFIAGFCVMIAIIIFNKHVGATDRFGWDHSFANSSFIFYFLIGFLMCCKRETAA